MIRVTGNGCLLPSLRWRNHKVCVNMNTPLQFQMRMWFVIFVTTQQNDITTNVFRWHWIGRSQFCKQHKEQYFPVFQVRQRWQKQFLVQVSEEEPVQQEAGEAGQEWRQHLSRGRGVRDSGPADQVRVGHLRWQQRGGGGPLQGSRDRIWQSCRVGPGTKKIQQKEQR